MTITILTPDAKQFSKNGRRKTDSKHFEKGKADKTYYQHPYTYDVVHSIKRDPKLDELDILSDILEAQEKTNADWIQLFEGLTTDQTKSIRVTKEYLEHDIPRYIIQLDFDGEYEGANFLTIEERDDIAIKLLPVLEGVKRVAHLSNKAGFVHEYPNHLALRLYVELDRHSSNKTLRTVFEKYGLGTPIGIDHSIFSNRRKHLIQRPTVGDEYTPIEFEQRILKMPGSKLSLEKMMKTEQWKDANKDFEAMKKVASSITDSHIKASEEDLEGLNELAEDGYFDKVSRHDAHHTILARGIWKNQNEDVLMDVIVNDSRILGSKTREDLEAQCASIHKKNKKYFDSDIALKEFDYRLEVNSNDLKDADLSALLSQLTNAVRTGKPIGLICRSPHGSGKTMALLPMIYKCLAAQYPDRPIRLCYISGLRSIVTGTTRKLKADIQNIECYLEKDGTVNQQTIDTAHSIAIGAKSLERVTKTSDIVFCDESEEIGLWSTWDNSFHNKLVEIMGQSKVFVMADADASEMTYSLAVRAQEYQQHSLAILDNAGSWIQGSSLTFLTKRYQAYDKIIEEVKAGKLVFAHVDYAGDTLLASCNALNQQLDDRKVVSFCSQKGCSLSLKDDSKVYGMQGLQQLHERPEETIDYLISKGYQVIMVSPTIQKGWRYHSPNNMFDTTVGIYIYGNITAPTIVQRTQRCVGVTDHYVFQQSASTFVDTNAYEKNLIEEMELSIYGGHAGALNSPIRHNKEILSEATLITSRCKANIKLHLYYVWQAFGGRIKHEEAKENSVYDKIRGLLKDIKKAMRLEEALQYQEDPEMLQGLIDRLTVLEDSEGTRTAADMKTTDGIMIALARIKSYEYAQPDVEKVLRNLFSTEEQSKHWDMYGAHWINLASLDDNEKMEASLRNKEGGGHAKLWLLLDQINRNIWNVNKLDIRELRNIDRKRTIAINVDDIDDTEYHKLYMRYQNLYLDHLPTMNAYKSPKLFFKKLMELVFQCKVKYGEPKDVKNIKAGLIKDYMDRGFIKKSKNLKPNTNDRPCSDILRKHIMLGDRLSNAEQDYVNHSGKIIVLTLPQILPTAYYERYEYLSMRYEEARSKSNVKEELFEVI